MSTRAIFVLLLVLAPCAGAEEFKVAADGSADYPTIIDAIAATANGDTVTLLDGVYTGEGNRDLTNWGNTIHIRSLSGDPEACVIDCEGSPSEYHRGFWLSITGSKQDPPYGFWGLDGITIMNGYDYAGGAVVVSDGAWPGVINCIFENNCGLDRGGAIDLNESGLDVIDCLFIDNRSGEEGGAISFDYYSSFHVTGSTFIGNEAQRGGAIRFRRTNWIYEMSGCTFYGNHANQGCNFYFEDDAHLSAENCILSFGEIGQAVFCEPDCSVTLVCCDIFGNAGGNWTGCIVEQLGVDGNIEIDPLFCNAAIFDLTLDAASSCAPLSPPNGECDLIGAWPVACGATATKETSWSSLKGRF